MFRVNLAKVRRTTIKELGTVEELQSHKCLSENSSDWPRTGAIAAISGCKTGQKLVHGIEKRGQKFLPPKFFSIFFRLRISRRF